MLYRTTQHERAAIRQTTQATFPHTAASAILGQPQHPIQEKSLVHTSPFKPDHRLFPFESKWFDSRVGKVHYVDEGAGDPILLLHGNPTWSFLYRGIIIRLKKHFRCIAVDYPGFGLSTRPDTYGYTPAEQANVVRDLVRHLDLKNLTIMGQDWGGPIGLRVAVDELPRVRALVMGNTWFWPVDSWQGKSFAYVMSMAPVQSQIINNNFFVEKVMPRAVKHPLPDEVMDHYRAALPTPTSRMGVAEFPVQLMAATQWLRDLEEDVQTSLPHVPMLLTWGMHDLMFTRPFMERFRETFTNCRVQRLDAKHYIQEDAPKEISAAIQSFLESPGKGGA
jgi:haloalkane dehalogenase|tara:strand:- start:451 stop:1455 length:1005 start_codon:yes stop_codon:yes gene_type:complete